MTLHHVKQFTDEELHYLVVNTPIFVFKEPINKNINDRTFTDCMELLRRHILYVPRPTIIQLMVPNHLRTQVEIQGKLEGLL